MSLLERFLGLPDLLRPPSALAANPAMDSPLCLQVLFPAAFDFDGEAIAQSLRSLDPILAKARAETQVLDAGRQPDNSGDMIGLAGWGPHVVKLVYFNGPIPPRVFDACVRPAHVLPELKADAAGHRSHVMLHYGGDVLDPLDQYVALAVVAAALARLGAILIVNEVARTAFPAEALSATDEGIGFLESLRALPIPLLYSGFVKVEVEGTEGVWMRTYGCQLLNLPDLATLAEGHHRGGETFDLFTSILNYIGRENVEFAAGQVVELGPGAKFRFRIRTEGEWWLESAGALWVLDRVT